MYIPSKSSTTSSAADFLSNYELKSKETQPFDEAWEPVKVAERQTREMYVNAEFVHQENGFSKKGNPKIVWQAWCDGELIEERAGFTRLNRKGKIDTFVSKELM